MEIQNQEEDKIMNPCYREPAQPPQGFAHSYVTSNRKLFFWCTFVLKCWHVSTNMWVLSAEGAAELAAKTQTAQEGLCSSLNV